MEAPFVFGKIAAENNFTDRERETADLVSYFTSLVNVVLISPRRWGKSSLVNKASKVAVSKDKKLRVCHIDLFNIRNEEHFYALLTKEVIQATAGKWEEIMGNMKKFFSRLVPKITFSTDPGNEFSVDFDWDDVRKNPEEVLDLAEKIAVAKGLKIVVCIDEFQNISDFSEPEYFQKKLRSHWQKHQHVSYCLYGSKRHMMLEFFTDSSKPFYKFGNLMFLDKIDEKHLVDFFKRRFMDTGKRIDSEAGRLIARLVDNHPYYAQQLAQLAWLRTKDRCTEKIVTEAHDSLVEQLSLLFVTMTDSLTTQQLCYLNALIAGEQAISSTEVMHRYNISSATSVVRSRIALVKGDILDDKDGKVVFQDPIYAFWLKTRYFAK